MGNYSTFRAYQQYKLFKVLHVCVLIDSSHNKTNKCTNVKIIFCTHNLLQL